jgi:hypothetical protein
MAGKTRRVKNRRGGAGTQTATQFIENEFHKVQKLYDELKSKPSTTPDEIRLLKRRAAAVQNAVMQEMKELRESGIDLTRTFLGELIYEENLVDTIEDIKYFIKLEEAKHQAVAVTGAHPESTMPNPDIASMVGKFLGGKRKTRKLKNRKTGKRKTRK